ncbi:MAG: hypothetical protein JRI68_04610 [Deltaproteobacteria bacterium]|nr:hypothetical protein [Deltaproteobacteria bacterium]
MADNEKKEPRFSVPMPGGGVARLPLEVLEQYRDGEASACHAEAPARAESPAGHTGSPEGHTSDAADSGITVNIYAGGGQVRVEQHHEPADDDVVAHHLAVDASTGVSDWHTDWEYGECDYTDESGFPQRILAWHRHPLATEYTELFEG